MTNFAVVSFSGKVGKMKFFEVGEKKSLKASFSVAINKSRKVGDEWKQETSWLPCVAWGRIASLLKEKAQPGLDISGSGHWNTESYQKDGKPVSFSAVVLSVVDLKVKKPEDSSAAPQYDSNQYNVPSDSDIPF